MSGRRHRLSGGLTVALPPGEAFVLFTPRGEERWAEGWRPAFPAPADDDTAPGTVFETSVDGETTTWVVVERDQGRRISYARLTPGSRAGTVTVTLEGRPGGDSAVRVTYELTALSAAAEHELDEFAAGYDDYLRSWEEAIAGHLAR